jgi:hypothetical protein
LKKSTPSTKESGKIGAASWRVEESRSGASRSMVTMWSLERLPPLPTDANAM